MDKAHTTAWEARKASAGRGLTHQEDYTFGRPSTEAALTEFFNLPNWREGLEKIGKLADDINSAETFAIVKEEILLALAEKMLPLFDELRTERDVVNDVSGKENFKTRLIPIPGCNLHN